MGIDILWEDECGDCLAQLLDERSLVQRFLPGGDAVEFSCLRFVDHYGDALFNQAQITQLLTELEKIHLQVYEPELKQYLKQAIEFVRSTAGAVHTYVRFRGD